MRNTRHVAIAAAALILAACSTDPVAPKAGVTDAMITRDLASDAAQSVALDLDQIMGAELAAGIPLTAMKEAAAPLCPYSATAQRFVCPAITTPDGVTLERSYAIYAAGAPQAAYDPVRTDSMNFQSLLVGTLQQGGHSAWLRHTRTMTVSGLAGTETRRVWNGIGARSDSAHVTGDGPARMTRVESVDRMADVVYRVPRAAFPYPESGTITQDIVASAAADGAPADRLRSTVRHVVVTFDGTRTARILVGAKPCTLDLVTRAVSCS